jgi:hypothetical protein
MKVCNMEGDLKTFAVIRPNKRKKKLTWKIADRERYKALRKQMNYMTRRGKRFYMKFYLDPNPHRKLYEKNWILSEQIRLWTTTHSSNSSIYTSLRMVSSGHTVFPMHRTRIDFRFATLPIQCHLSNKIYRNGIRRGLAEIPENYPCMDFGLHHVQFCSDDIKFPLT